MTDQRAEENRAVSAMRIAHAARALLRERPDVTIADLRDAAPELRLTLKAIAYRRSTRRVTAPSDRTWAIVMRLLEQPAPHDPFRSTTREEH